MGPILVPLTLISGAARFQMTLQQHRSVDQSSTGPIRQALESKEPFQSLRLICLYYKKKYTHIYALLTGMN